MRRLLLMMYVGESSLSSVVRVCLLFVVCWIVCLIVYTCVCHVQVTTL